MEFKNKEIVFLYKQPKDELFSQKVLKLNIEKTGKNCELDYKVGDDVLIDLDRPHYTFKWEKEDYLVIDERHIICEL